MTLGTDALTMQPLSELTAGLRRKRFSPVELARFYQAQIDAGRRLDAFITEPGAEAMAAARRAEKQLARGDGGRLCGVPIAIKDLFATKGVRTTAGSRILRDWIPEQDAAVVRRLRAEGALIFGKTNLHEFAYGVTNANPWWGIARNPRDETRVPGGSSGGSAIAVVAGMAAAALGSDTGGSIRIPASLCGCVGLKPTYGSIPLEGAMPLGWSLDHAGPLTRSVDDAGFLFDVLSGSTSWQQARSRGRRSTERMRVAVLRGNILRPCEPGVLRAIDDAARALGRQGLRLQPLEIPELQWSIAMQLATLRAEAAAVHARWFPAKARSYGRDVRVRLQLGRLVSGPDYVLAQRMRARLREALRRVFQSTDVLLLPTTPITAPAIGERTVRWRNTTEPVDGALVRLTQPFNLTGVPALSVPWLVAGKLPIGMQVVGAWGNEAAVLTVGRLIEALSK